MLKRRGRTAVLPNDCSASCIAGVALRPARTQTHYGVHPMVRSLELVAAQHGNAATAARIQILHRLALIFVVWVDFSA